MLRSRNDGQRRPSHSRLRNKRPPSPHRGSWNPGISLQQPNLTPFELPDPSPNIVPALVAWDRIPSSRHSRPHWHCLSTATQLWDTKTLSLPLTLTLEIDVSLPPFPLQVGAPILIRRCSRHCIRHSPSSPQRRPPPVFPPWYSHRYDTRLDAAWSQLLGSEASTSRSSQQTTATTLNETKRNEPAQRRQS